MPYSGIAHNTVDITGKEFGRLTVVSRSGTKEKRATWLCICTCGASKIIAGKELRSGKIRSCGCLAAENRLENCRVMRQRQKAGELSFGNLRHGEGKKGHQSRRFFLLHAAKARSKRYEVPFNLSLEDIPLIPRLCPVLGIPLFHGSARILPNSPSLDRILPELGYVPGNIRIISYRANQLKSNATASELEAILRDAKSLRPFA